MQASKTYIEFTVLHLSNEDRIRTFWDEYDNLRELINNTLHLQGFGQCKGMGRCATCLVEVSRLTNHSSLERVNKDNTTSSATENHSQMKLACQVQINDDLANVLIKVLGN